MNSAEVAFEESKKALQSVVIIRETVHIVTGKEALPEASGHCNHLVVVEPGRIPVLMQNFQADRGT